MDGFLFPALGPVAKRVAPLIGAVVIAGAGIGYALHEHNNAQSLAAKNEQSSAQLDATRMQLDALTAKVNALAASNEANSEAGREANGGARPTSSSFSTGTETSRRAVTHRARGQDSRFKKLQSQLDAQGKEIDETRSDLANTHTDLTNTRTELSGSIARTHDELVMLEKKGERNYFEFDISKSKQFKHEGPVGISLRKTNERRGYADLMLMVDDRNLQTKHVNLFQPSMFYESDSPQPIEIVINDVTKDHIHGYVSAPKYRRSELAAMTSGGANPAASAEQAANSGQGDNGIVGQPASSTDQPASTNTQPAVRQKLTLPDQDPSQH